MAAALAYLDPDHSPSREEIDRSSGVVLLEFGTPWCGYCQAIAGHVSAQLSRRPEIRHIKVEDGAGLELGRTFRVKLWPNFVFLRDGRVLTQLARPSRQELDAAFLLATGTP